MSCDIKNFDMAVNITPETTLEKLEQLHTVHAKTGNMHRGIGADTLSMIFNTSFSNVITVLEELESRQMVSLTYNVNNNDKRKVKNPIVMVHLL